jgi:hypothetical protein
MLTKRQKFLIVFLGYTFMSIALELYAVLDGKSWTEPWTELIVKFIPRIIGVPLVLAFSMWLSVHFLSRYWHHPILSPRPKSTRHVYGPDCN